MKRLYKSSKNKVFFGVAGGIAEYFELDPVLIRIAFVLLTIFHGSGILIYIICAIVIPKDYMLNYMYSQQQSNTDNINPNSSETAPPLIPVVSQSKNREVLGYVLIVIGTLILIPNIIPNWGFSDILPLGLIIFGGWLVINSINKKQVIQ